MTADLLRQVCQPRFDIPDGENLIYLSMISFKFSQSNLFHSAEQVFGAREGKFAEDKNFKVKKLIYNLRKFLITKMIMFIIFLHLGFNRAVLRSRE